MILGSPGFAGFYTGSASAQAQFSGLHASAQGAHSGGLPGPPTALPDSASAAFFSDSLTITSPLVAPQSAGSVGYRFQVDGSLSAPGTPAPSFFGETLADLAFQHEDGPVFGAAHFYARRGETGTAINGGVPTAGWIGSTGQKSRSARSPG